MPNSNDSRFRALEKPLILGNYEAIITEDIDQLAEHISLAVPVRDIAPVGPSQQFRHRSSYRIAGDMGLAAATATPTRMWVDESSDCAVVLLNQGHARYVLDGHDYLASAGSSGMFLPGMDYLQETSLASGLIYNLSPQLLARYLCEASGGTLHLDEALHQLNRPTTIDLEHPAMQQVLFGLQVLICTVDSIGVVQQPDSQPLVRLQEGIYALSAALLMPEYAPKALNCWKPMPLTTPGGSLGGDDLDNGVSLD
ncbi:MAG: hypothetical protein KFB97_07580 [Cyanobium sp. M30B3]|nr:MAG: hypothetical protein KFB97_07580 [Cyanobium sp. M30B3]